MQVEVRRFVVTDADTGDEIIFFFRRGKPYLWLRDKRTKRFIKRLKEVELRVFMVVDYSASEARKGNPLYVDAGAFTRLKPEEFAEKGYWEQQLEWSLTHVVAKNFGYYVTTRLLELSGIEYGSMPKYGEKLENREFHYVLTWKHHPEDKGKTREGVENV
jgi:hypothetical protein